MVSRAQLSQARSRRRRETLLHAAMEVFADGGSRAVTHRAVAGRAGLPSATTTYYFASIEELLREALTAQIDEWRSGLETIAHEAGELTLDGALDLIVSTLCQRSAGRARRELAVYLEASADPALQDLARELSLAIEGFMNALLILAGVPEPRQLASGMVRITSGSTVLQASDLETSPEELQQLRTNLRALSSYHFAQRGAIDSLLSENSPSSGRSDESR